MTYAHDGLPTGEHQVVTIQTQFDADAVASRQNHIITLLRGVRALGIALVILFAVFGAAGAALLASTNETRENTRQVRIEQHAVLCDLYARSEKPIPRELACP